MRSLNSGGWMLRVIWGAQIQNQIPNLKLSNLPPPLPHSRDIWYEHLGVNWGVLTRFASLLVHWITMRQYLWGITAVISRQSTTQSLPWEVPIWVGLGGGYYSGLIIAKVLSIRGYGKSYKTELLMVDLDVLSSKMPPSQNVAKYQTEFTMPQAFRNALKI